MSIDNPLVTKILIYILIVIITIMFWICHLFIIIIIALLKLKIKSRLYHIPVKNAVDFICDLDEKTEQFETNKISKNNC